jgi:hypothetical protein
LLHARASRVNDHRNSPDAITEIPHRWLRVGALTGRSEASTLAALLSHAVKRSERLGCGLGGERTEEREREVCHLRLVEQPGRLSVQ